MPSPFDRIRSRLPGLQSFIDRVRSLVQRDLPEEDPSAPPPAPVEVARVRFQGPLAGLPDVMARVQFAARQVPPLLLNEVYHDTPRRSEPYSYRYRAKEEPHVPLLYVYCHKDHNIEAHKLQRIQDLQVTAQPFPAIRWPIEF